MKRIAIIIGAIACVIGLAACGSSGGSTQTVDMGDYTFEAPASWGNISLVNETLQLYAFGGEQVIDQDAQLMRSELSRSFDEDTASVGKMSETLESRLEGCTDVEDFNIGGWPAQSGISTDVLVDGTTIYSYSIVFSPDQKDYVVINVWLDGVDDADGIETAKALRDSIQLVGE